MFVPGGLVAVGVGTGLDECAAEGDPVGDRRAEPGITQSLVPLGERGVVATAVALHSSRSVKIWNSSFAPFLSRLR